MAKTTITKPLWKALKTNKKNYLQSACNFLDLVRFSSIRVCRPGPTRARIRIKIDRHEASIIDTGDTMAQGFYFKNSNAFKTMLLWYVLHVSYGG